MECHLASVLPLKRSSKPSFRSWRVSELSHQAADASPMRTANIRILGTSNDQFAIMERNFERNNRVNRREQMQFAIETEELSKTFRRRWSGEEFRAVQNVSL